MNTIQRHVGNLLDVKTGVIVHGCNTHGVMGAGVAKAVRERYPGAFRVYHRMCQQPGIDVGQIVPYEVPSPSGRTELLIVNAITQYGYGMDKRQVNYEGLYCCFAQLKWMAKAYKLEDVHFPLIGCGLGGGDWDIVEAIIKSTLKGLNLHLWLLE